jgi:hypothetical protein
MSEWMTRRAASAAGAAVLAVLAALAVGESPAARKTPASQTYEQAVLKKKPVAYWPLKEAAGPTAHDRTGNNHNGTYKGKITHDVKDGIGLKGQACVEVPDSKAFSQPTSGKGLSVEAWMRPDALTFAGQTKDPYVHWLGKGKQGQEEWALRFYSKKSKDRPNRISGYLFNPSTPAGVKNLGAGAYFQDKLKVGAWVHVVACYDPGDKKTRGAGVSIYRNGVFQNGPKTTSGALYGNKLFNIVPAHTRTPLRLGAQDLQSFLVGGLQDVAVYPRVLTAAEIMENFKAH